MYSSCQWLQFCFVSSLFYEGTVYTSLWHIWGTDERCVPWKKFYCLSWFTIKKVCINRQTLIRGCFFFCLWSFENGSLARYIQLRQPRLRQIEALSGFGGEYRSRKEGRNFDCSDSWRILPDSRVLAWRPHDLPRSGQATHHSLQRSHPHLNSIFASKLHARAPLHWVICIRLIRWHGAHLQAVVIVMDILLPDPEKIAIIFVIEKLEGVT